MLLYLVVVVLAVSCSGVQGQENECTYTIDCAKLEKCQNVQDGSCVCNFGKCVSEGQQDTTECQKENDCWSQEKCQDIDCRCSSYNTCEPYDCYDVTDCFNGAHDCANYNGYTCQCSSNVCETVLSEDSLISSIQTKTDNEDGTCNFSDDCKGATVCLDNHDSSCVCKNGICMIDEQPTFKGNECTNHTDCACRDDPDNCYCRAGYCKEESWECHGYEDCGKYPKCQSISCLCSTNDLCEPYYECTTTDDCLNGGYDCATLYEGYTCSCENFFCNLKAVDYPSYDSQSVQQHSGGDYESSGNAESAVNYDYYQQNY